MDAFLRDGVVPDVLDAVPESCLQVKYGSISLTPGGTLTPSQVKDKPTIEYEAEAGAYYSLLCNAPDAPTREDQTMGEYHNWLVVNIPGNDVSSGQETTHYVGPGAVKGSGLHRFVILLYKQTNGKLDVGALPKITNTSAEGRWCHKARDFAKKFDLQLIAGNFFQAEWDEYASTVRAQLGLSQFGL